MNIIRHIVFSLLIFIMLCIACSRDDDTFTYIPKHSVSTPKSPLEKEELVFYPDSFKNGIWIQKYSGNYSCFKFESTDGLKLVSDPFNAFCTDPDIVTISHYDYDHCDTDDFASNYYLVDSPGTYDIPGCKITGYRGLHYRGLDKSNIAYFITMDSIVIGHFGSMGEPLKDNLDDFEILIIQVTNSSQKMSMQEIEQIITSNHVKVIIPAHTDTALNDDLAERLHGSYWRYPEGNICITKERIERIKDPVVISLDN